MTLRSVVGKTIPVFSRDPNGRTRFRPMHDVQMICTAQPVVRVLLDNGFSFRASGAQLVFTRDMQLVPLAELAPGTVLASAFHYPAGYRYRVDATGTEAVSAGGWRVVRVEAGGKADLFSVRVPPHDCFFLTAGILCKSAPSR